MGTSGNRPGYKVFSFNTSVRNPKRNREFLSAFEQFNGLLFDKNLSKKYLCELVKRGIYKFLKVQNHIKDKWENNIPLTDDEIEQLIKDNPQATGEHNRVMTSYMRALKDQGFLIFKREQKGKYNKIFISKLGKDLLDQNIDISIVYTKAMLGLHANNPARVTNYNKSRPFLNTLFVIKEVNRIWQSLGNEAKGIMRHEFAAFVLSMKDCDYLKAANEIIEYRKKFKFKINKQYLTSYLKANDIQELAIKSLIRDYPDDVFRKFEMTGLIKWHGKFSNIYYDFSNYNIGKVNQILEMYKEYNFETFDSVDDYYDYLHSIEIPWEDNLKLKKQIAIEKANYLNISIKPDVPIEEQEIELDRIFYATAISKTLNKFPLKTIFKELMILSGVLKDKPNSNLDKLEEPLRLEYLLALALGNLYGTEGLISNIIYNENGEPMHYATGGKADIYLIRKGCSLILEPTLQCGSSQANNETASVNRHAEDFIKQHNISCKVVVVAPKIHTDTIDHLTYRSSKFARTGAVTKELLAITIAKIVGLFNENKNYMDLLSNLHEIFKFYQDNETNLEKCSDFINSYKPNKSYYLD